MNLPSLAAAQDTRDSNLQPLRIAVSYQAHQYPRLGYPQVLSLMSRERLILKDILELTALLKPLAHPRGHQQVNRNNHSAKSSGQTGFIEYQSVLALHPKQNARFFAALNRPVTPVNY